MKTIKPPKFSVGSFGKASSKNDPIATALYLAEQRSKLSERDDSPYGEMIGNVSSQLYENLGNKRGGWRSLVGGVLQGVKNSSDLSKLFNNQKKAEEFAKTLDYFQEINNAKLQQQQYYEQIENAQREMRPEVLAYFQNQKKDPQTADLSGRQMWDKYKSLTGVSGEWLGWMPLNENVAMIKDGDRIKQVDIRPLLLGDEYTTNEIATLGQDYQNKLQEQRQENDRKYELEARKVGSLERVNNKRSDLYNAQINALKPVSQQATLEGVQPEISNERGEIPLERMGKKFVDEWSKVALKEINQIPTNRRAIETVREMRAIFDKYPEIGSSFLNAVSTASEDEGLKNIIARNISEFSDPEQYAAVRELEKLSSDLELSTVMGLPGKTATDILKRAIQKAAPSGKLPYRAFNMIADSWEKRATENIQRAQKIEDALSRGMYLRDIDNIEDDNELNDVSTDDLLKMYQNE